MPAVAVADLRCAADGCGAPTASGGGRCSGCRSVGYCSAACQRADWAARHKRLCSRLRDGKCAEGEATWGRSGLKEACEEAANKLCRKSKFSDLVAQAAAGDVTALYLVGEMYIRGSDGQVVDHKKGAEYWQRAASADLTDDKNVCGINAAMNLAVCYREGVGVRKSAAEAFRFLRIAAEHGHSSAQQELAQCFLAGEGTEPDAELGLTWARRAATHGEPKALHTLGVLLAESNRAEAAGFLERAIAGGERRAERQLFKLADAGVKEALEALERLGL